jgi:hypothetical protein
MLTIEVPDELAAPLADQAARRGTTPEALALDHLRLLLSPPPPGSLLEFLGDRVGAVAGTGEAFSQDGGRRFTDGLAEGRAARP